MYGKETKIKDTFDIEYIKTHSIKKIKYSTYEHCPYPGVVAIRHHHTDIVTTDRNKGTVTINTNGWHSSTTKERINANIPAHIYVRQHKWEWYIIIQLGHGISIDMPYEDNIELPLEQNVYVNKAKQGEYGNKIRLQLLYGAN